MTDSIASNSLPEPPLASGESAREANDRERWEESLSTVERVLERFKQCSPEEKERLHRDVEQLRGMAEKLTGGRIDIVIFGEISTGKSALINALVGKEVASVDVQGGWTKEAWRVDWDGCGYVMHGLDNSQVVLVDTPGLNEVGGVERGQIAREVAEQAELILFVTDSDLNEIEHAALVELAAAHKPIIVVLNKVDLYSPEQRARLLEVLRDERLRDLVPAKNIVETAADPRSVEYIIEAPDGSTRSEWRTPQPQVSELKARILEVLERDGLALLALNAAMFAADKTDRIASLRVELRSRQANQTIWSFAGFKSIAVALNPIAVADILGGSVVDVSMILTLSKIYGLQMTWRHAQRLASSIAQAAGWVMLGELTTHLAASFFKGITFGYGTALTAVPQGAAAGYGSYIVGQAAKYYFEHGASWGGEAPKAVVSRILEETDKESVLEQLRAEIKKKLSLNKYAATKK